MFERSSAYRRSLRWSLQPRSRSTWWSLDTLSARRFVGSQRAASARALSDASVKRQPPSTTFEAGNHDLLGRVGDFGMRQPGRPAWNNTSSIEHHFG